MKFKVGDKVRIVSKEKIIKLIEVSNFVNSRISCANENNLTIHLCRGNVTIRGKNDTEKDYIYFILKKINGSLMSFMDWPEDMLELENPQLELEL